MKDYENDLRYRLRATNTAKLRRPEYYGTSVERSMLATRIWRVVFYVAMGIAFGIVAMILGTWALSPILGPVLGMIRG